MSLRDAILGWDGKDAAAIGRIYGAYRDTKAFQRELVRLAGEPDTEVGATWLLKRWLEEDDAEGGGGLPADLAGEWCAVMTELGHWEARLHALQCVRFVRVPDERFGEVERFARTGAEAREKFVRAWAMDALYRLSLHRPEMRAPVRRVLESALENDPAASVRARVRRVLREGFASG